MFKERLDQFIKINFGTTASSNTEQAAEKVEKTTQALPSIDAQIRNKEYTEFKNLDKLFIFSITGVLSTLFGIRTIKDGALEGNIDKMAAGAGFIGLGTFSIRAAYTSYKTIKRTEDQIYSLKSTRGR